MCQQIKTLSGPGVYYYTDDRSSCEVDFILEKNGLVIPSEVKAETNLKSKSLRTYMDSFF
ncbi:MAG: DUF4143 domain-containing protein [Eubacterium sp.]